MVAYFPGLLTLTLLLLNAFDVINVSWWLVFAPVIAQTAIGLLLLALFFGTVKD